MAIKIHEIDRTVYFKEVALIIGKRKARKELRRLFKNNRKVSLDSGSYSAGLESAFIWILSPQGAEFWINIHMKLHRLKMKEW